MCQKKFASKLRQPSKDLRHSSIVRGRPLIVFEALSAAAGPEMDKTGKRYYHYLQYITVHYSIKIESQTTQKYREIHQTTQKGITKVSFKKS